jgi:uncharacterized protein (DUF924 family)
LPNPLNILKFWFDDIDHALWFKKDMDFDQLLLERFSILHTQARQGELHLWRRTAKGRLAEVIILDQFSRNMFRDTAQSFAQDGMALILAQEAISRAADTELTQIERNFLYMPFMHSESLYIHDIAIELFTQNGLHNTLDFELKHQAIIKRFGRYPHRNALLGRQSNDEEMIFLQQAGSGF